MLVCAVTLTVYWKLESDVWIEPSTVVIASQLQGDSIAVDIPADKYAQALHEFKMRTQVRTRTGRVLSETALTAYVPNVKYKFVTPRHLPTGNYEVRIILGHQLNPISYRELDKLLAIIFVSEDPNDNPRPAASVQ